METYRTWTRLFELQRYYSWIVDRFNISTQMYQIRAHMKHYDFRWLEDRLLTLNFRLVFCYRTPESFASARAESLKVSGKPSQYNNLSLFVQEQDQMKTLVRDSRIPALWVDVSDDTIPGAVNSIADWLEASGGLFAK